jgi:hypothetical protein
VFRHLTNKAVTIGSVGNLVSIRIHLEIFDVVTSSAPLYWIVGKYDPYLRLFRNYLDTTYRGGVPKTNVNRSVVFYSALHQMNDVDKDLQLYGEDVGIKLVTSSYAGHPTYQDKIKFGRSLAVHGIYAVLKRGQKKDSVSSGYRSHLSRLLSSDPSGNEWYFGTDKEKLQTSLQYQEGGPLHGTRVGKQESGVDRKHMTLADVESWLDDNAASTKGTLEYNTIVLDDDDSDDSDGTPPTKRQKVEPSDVPGKAIPRTLEETFGSDVPDTDADVPSTSVAGTSAETSKRDVPGTNTDVPSTSVAGTSVGASKDDVLGAILGDDNIESFIESRAKVMKQELVAASVKVGPAMAAIWNCGSGDKRLATHLKRVHSSLLEQYDPSGVALAHLDSIINSPSLPLN